MALTTCPNCEKTSCDASIEKSEPAKSKFFLKKLWRGEYSLPVAFWLFYFLVNFILNATAYRAPLFYVSLLGMDTGRWIVALPLFLIAYFGYLIACVVGVWRSAARYAGPKGWAFAARLYLVLSAFSTVNAACNVLLIPGVLLLRIYFMGL